MKIKTFFFTFFLFCGLSLLAQNNEIANCRHNTLDSYSKLNEHSKKCLQGINWPKSFELDLNGDSINEIFMPIIGNVRGMSYALFTKKNDEWILISGQKGIVSGHLGIKLKKTGKNGWFDFVSYQPSGRGGVNMFIYKWSGSKYFLEKIEKDKN